ncbi:beta-glucuronidase (plasmid) [Fulvitalea axinellae]|uniref:Beta-glucuronidase n=2 Tax=Fulvitalea axinellae TaxID=1182444 RepID=A0AAU9D8J8_9BACT|nr:beta-glucuronidase [Fulvitalea axinellae]
MRTNTMVALLFALFFSIGSADVLAEGIVLQNAENREGFVLDGLWNVRLAPFRGGNGKGMSKPMKPGAKDESFVDRLAVPGDWNTQAEKLYYYEGSVFYKRNFKWKKNSAKRYILHFGAANYEAEVFLNGNTIGTHKGGFTPFDFEVTDELLNGDNTLVVKVTNQRKKESIPTIRFDWWNYGGLTRSVKLVEVGETFISDYSVALDQNDKRMISGWTQLDGKYQGKEVTVEIPELKIKKSVTVSDNGKAEFIVKPKRLELWSPETPKLYTVRLTVGDDKVEDKIGFRSIETKNGDILLNGKKVFLRGINLHEEAPMGGGRLTTAEECRTLLGWAKELGCNFVRLAHYPHSEMMVREAERMGLMVWAEIPVYWKIDFENETAYANAEQMLVEMVQRDRNRASVILWSVANETRESEARQRFLGNLLKKTKELDPVRLTTAALEAFKEVDGVRVIDDPLGDLVDVLGVNCYCGWYFRKPTECPELGWEIKFDKPVIFSEFGAGALQGHYGDKSEKWTEEYQEEVYRQNIGMIKEQMPFLDGMTPWILVDFRSPIRPNRVIQNDYNRKGLLSEKGVRKKAFYVLQKFYQELEEKAFGKGKVQ